MTGSRCQVCGSSIPAAIESGACPRCAMRMALDETEAGHPVRAGADGADPAGSRIDRYVLTRKLGEGGMGEVWLAEQSEPVRRQVALKIIKRGMDSEHFVARFESERQALAMMDHCAVARVFDAGATPEGRPYLVMEYVDGLPITDYCDRERLTTRERLELFREVCGGVQHAHQKAILHRDLKPTNVLVALDGDRPVPKIIDFGVAKALDAKLTERTLFTELGVLVGTPEYMSPEQAEAGGSAVDTRTDVYSLGVLLYELLAGCLPFDSKELRAAGYDGIRRVIREQDAVLPSLRVSSLGEAMTAPAADRRSDPGSLSRQLRGDLDWIVMKALEKDPQRRYGSPAELGADLERHLADEPVVAGPPTARYRIGKFVRRHRLGVALASTAVVALIAIAALQTVHGVRLERERDRAAREAATANRVVAFLTGLFAEADPIQARGAEMTAREILDRGTRTIDTGLEDEPAIRGRLLATIGWIQIQLGMYDEAFSTFERALALRTSALGPDHPDTLRSAFSAGAALVYLGRAEEAEERLRPVFERQQTVLGVDHEDPWETANYIARAVHGTGDLEAAFRWHRLALEGRQAVLGGSAEPTLSSVANVGLALKDLGRFEEAEPYYRRALEGFRSEVGADHPETLSVQNNLGMLLLTLDRLDEAETVFRDTLELRDRVLGASHPLTMGTVNDLASALQLQGRLEEAEPLRRRVLERARADLGGDHPDVVRALNNLGSLLMSQGKFDQAEPVFREAADGAVRTFGAEHPNSLVVRGNLGQALCGRGRTEDGARILTEVVEVAGRVLPREHVITGFSVRKLGSCQLAAGRDEQAEATLLEAVEILDAAVGPDHGQTRDAVAALLELYDERGDDESAGSWRERLP